MTAEVGVALLRLTDHGSHEFTVVGDENVFALGQRGVIAGSCS